MKKIKSKITAIIIRTHYVIANKKAEGFIDSGVFYE